MAHGTKMMEQIEKLFASYTESDLTDEQAQQLCAMLRSSDAAVDWFVRECFLQWQLRSLFRQRSVHADVINAPAVDDAAIIPLSAAQATLPNFGADASTARRPDRRVWWAFAASLAIAVGAAVWTITRQPVVGQLTQARSDAKWSTASDSPGVGSLLHAGGELRLGRGRVLVTLVSGAQIVFEGPAQARLLGENEVWLSAGRLGATVPPQATGFTVSTPVGKFVDLGTEFTLDVQPARGARLYVFAGLVDVQPNTGPSFKIPQSKAIDYAAATGDATPLDFNQEQRIEL
jgi:hypothetical protein